MEKKDNGQATPGSEKDQLKELSLLASDGEDFNPGKEGVGGDKVGGGAAVNVDTGAVMGSLMTAVFAVLAARRGDHWMLSEGEAMSLGGAVAAVLDKYVPDMESGPEFALVMVSLTVIGPRAMTDIKVRDESPAEPSKSQQEKSSGGDPSKPKPAE